MQKVRRCLAIVVLLATFGMAALQGTGAGWVASTASSHHVSSISSSHASGKLADVCPGGGGDDC